MTDATLSKATTSNVERSRERFEEPLISVGTPILVNRIWRDSALIPQTAPRIEDYDRLTDSKGYQYYKVKTFRDGAAVRNLIYYYENVPLKRVLGTTNHYCSYEIVIDKNSNKPIVDTNTGKSKYISTKILEDIITDDFDRTYMPKVYVNGTLLPFGTGQVNWDISAGVMYFLDKEFAEKVLNSEIKVSFYKYVGRKGMFGDDGIDLPFRDNIKHFSSMDVDNATATIKVRGEANKNSNYILPPTNGKAYTKGENDTDSGVVVLQENLQDVMWSQNIKVSGGEWIERNGSRGVVRYDNPNAYNIEKV